MKRAAGLRAAARTLAAAVVVAALAAAATTSSAAGPFSFPHRPHLSADTIARAGAGQDADCRVCHDYSRGERDAHLKGCDACHVGREHLELKFAEAAPARPAFQHKEHLFDAKGAPRGDVSCMTCHAMVQDQDWIEFSVPTAGLGPRGRGDRGGGAMGVKTCADCHAAHEPKGGLVDEDERTGDGKACAQCHLGAASILPLRYRPPAERAAGERPFRHADHGGVKGECEACHTTMRASRTIWDHDPSQATAGKCAECHVDARGEPLVALSSRKTTVTRIDFEKFPHAAHVGKKGGETCQSCHFPETSPEAKARFPEREPSAEPTGRDQLVNYDVCVACHGADEWAPGKRSWAVEGHGVGAWACFKCHEGVADAQGRLPIAGAEVARATIGEARFSVHHHPGITSKGAPLARPTQEVGGEARQCTDCHVAGIEALASRLAGKPFAHAPHLPAQPDQDDCLACHSSSASARRSEDLARFDPHVAGLPAPAGANAAAKSCFECHVGATAAELGLETPPAKRRVAQFDHGGHVNAASLVAGAKGIACTQCHEEGGRFGYTTPPEVLDCTRCHAHEGDPAKVARTGPKISQGDASKCLNCHEAVRGAEEGRVGAQVRETIVRTHLALREGRQHHDKGGACASCHAREDAAQEPYRERIARAQVRTSIHEDPALAREWFNDPAIAKPGADPKGRTCATCHRNEPRGYLRSLSAR